VDFALSEREAQVRDLYREFSGREVEPGAGERDRTGRFHDELVPKLASSGIFGIPLPESVGGGGGTAVEFVLGLIEVAYADQSVAATVANQVGLTEMPIESHANRDQRERWLPALIAGDVLGCFALTEPAGGSDNNAMTTTAERTNGGWRIRGTKTFITNAGTSLTRVMIVAARTGTKPSGRAEIGAFLVELPRPGVQVSPPMPKLGWRSSDTRTVYFDDVLVADEACLGDPSTGLKAMLDTLTFGRVQIAALGVGLLHRCLSESVAYARTRHAFGSPIGAFQGVAFRIADIELTLRAARLLTLEAAQRRDAGLDYRAHASQAKLFASEGAMRAARDCLQIHASLGVLDDSVPARLFRDAKILEIGEGTSEIQRMLATRRLLGG
jgi:butyryl-CoA dehydrogenase